MAENDSQEDRDFTVENARYLALAEGREGVIFDFGGVIAYPPGAAWRAYGVAAELGLDRAGFDRGFRAYRHLWDGGFISGREMYRRIFADNGLAPHADDLERLLEADCAGWVQRFNPATRALMRNLKARSKKIGILTNMCVEFRDQWFLPRAQDYTALADALVVSGAHKLYKPQPEIYRLMERMIGLDGDKLLFFDDNLANVEGARRCGWHAEVYA